MTAIAYVITEPGTDEVLLEDGTWGAYERYWQRAEEFTSLVRANRRAVRVRAVVCAILKPDGEVDE